MNIILMSKNSIKPRGRKYRGGETTRNLITTRNPPVKGRKLLRNLTLSSSILRHKLVNTCSLARLISTFNFRLHFSSKEDGQRMVSLSPVP